MTGGWGPVDRFRMGAGCQEDQGMFRGLEISDAPGLISPVHLLPHTLASGERRGAGG